MSSQASQTARQRREAALTGPLLGHACDNTERARCRDIAYFWAWCDAAGLGGEHYPVDYAILAQFVESHVAGLAPRVHQRLLDQGIRRKGALRVGTLRRMLSSLSVVHLALDEPSACRDPRLHYRLRAAKRREAAPRKRRALTRDLLDVVVDACGDDARGLRDRAILLVGWAAGGLRRSELCALDIKSARRAVSGYVIKLTSTKTQVAGTELPLRGRAADALTAWLDGRGEEEGPLFVGIHRSGRFLGRLSGRAIDRIVRLRADAAGIDVSNIGAHSLRVGFLTEAGRRGISLTDAMEMSRHRTLRIAMDYYERGRLERNAAVDLLNDT